MKHQHRSQGNGGNDKNENEKPETFLDLQPLKEGEDGNAKALLEICHEIEKRWDSSDEGAPLIFLGHGHSTAKIDANGELQHKGCRNAIVAIGSPEQLASVLLSGMFKHKELFEAVMAAGSAATHIMSCWKRKWVTTKIKKPCLTKNHEQKTVSFGK